MALNITYGNDIQLRLLVTRDSVPFPIDLATGVQVNIVSIFSRRIPLEFQISGSALYTTVKSLPIGTYGIEVKGMLNKFNWRTYADASIVVTSATKAGDTSVTVPSDVYDVTMEASMYVGTLPLNNGGAYVYGISVLKGYFYALDGSTYLALVNSPATAPSEASNEWALLARKGHDFSYSDFTPEQISALQKPATDALAEMNTLKTNVETSEATRVTNEATRVTNESTRVTNEATRVTNESTRVTNENGRVEGEQARATAEQARVTDENTRLGAETLRDTQEGQRVANEQQRTTDEAGRATAETARASAETTRASAETTRVSNENTRVSNEQARVTAEAGRQATLNAKENSANKQNSLAADGTNTKYPTVDAVNTGLSTKLDTIAVKQVTGTSTTDVMSQKAITDILVTKADHGYSSNPKSLKQVEDAKENSANKQNSLATDGTGTKFPTVDAVNSGLTGINNNMPLQNNSFYIYTPSTYRVSSVKPNYTLKGNFTHIKKFNANTTAVGSMFFTIKTANGKSSIAFYNYGYTTRLTVINNGVTIYDLSQASSVWWTGVGVILQKTFVDYDKELITITYGANTFNVSVTGLRVMKDIEFTDIEIGINSYATPCAYSLIVQGLATTDIDGSKMLLNLSTPSTGNLVDISTPIFGINNQSFNFTKGKYTFDYTTLSGYSTGNNSYMGHIYANDSNKMFNYNNMPTNQPSIFVRYSFDVDVENASVYFKAPSTTVWKILRLINRDTLSVTDITTGIGMYNSVEIPIGRWTIVIFCLAIREYSFGLLNGWAGCNSGAVMTVYQNYKVVPVATVLSAYPQYCNFERGWCPYTKQFTTDFTAEFSNDII